MRARGLKRGAVGVLGLGCAALALAAPALAQATVPPTGPPTVPPTLPPPPPVAGADIDPSAPLDDMPDLGVAWPDLAVPEPVAVLPPVETVPPTTGAEAPAMAADDPGDALVVGDVGAARRYRVALTGIDAIEAGAAVRAEFDKQSALVADRKGLANAAQIDRRTRADVELLAELLRAQGYYDAAVEPDLAMAGEDIAIVLKVEAGTRYRFAAVELPGLEGAGGEAAELRAAFAVKAGDAVVAEQVIAAGSALRIALGEQGFASATIGEQEIVLDAEAKVARLSLPVTPGPVGRFGTIRVTGSPPFSARHVGSIARFRTGDRFERSDVDDLRRALVATGLESRRPARR